MTKQKKSIVQTPTKGKGGGKVSSSGSSSKGGKSESVELKDCPLEFRNFDSVDASSAPNYFGILKRPQNEVDINELSSVYTTLKICKV